jgi:hypothetical protein
VLAVSCKFSTLALLCLYSFWDNILPREFAIKSSDMRDILRVAGNEADVFIFEILDCDVDWKGCGRLAK